MEPLDWEKVGLPDPAHPPKGTYWHPYQKKFVPVLESTAHLQGAMDFDHEAARQAQQEARAREETATRPWPLDAPLDAGVPTDSAALFPEYTKGLAENMGLSSASPDAVNLPNHYARFKIEPIRFLVENFGPSILVGKVVKYSMRYDAKNGLEDLRKAKRCLELLIKFIEGDPDWWQAERQAR